MWGGFSPCGWKQMLPAPPGTFLLGPSSHPSPREPPVSGGWTPVLPSAHPGPLPGHIHPWMHTAIQVSAQFLPSAPLSLSPWDTRPPPPHSPAQRHFLIGPEEEADLDLGSMPPLLPGELGAGSKPWLEGIARRGSDGCLCSPHQ